MLLGIAGVKKALRARKRIIESARVIAFKASTVEARRRVKGLGS